MPLRQISNEHLSKILFNPLINEWTSQVKSVQKTFDEVSTELILKRNIRVRLDKQ